MQINIPCSCLTVVTYGKWQNGKSQFVAIGRNFAHGRVLPTVGDLLIRMSVPVAQAHAWPERKAVASLWGIPSRFLAVLQSQL